VAIGREARRAERAPLVESVLGKSAASAGLDLLELTEYAWHDCYGEITPPDDVILNILICSRGDLATMIHATKVALRDWRDLHLWAQHVNSEQQKLLVTAPCGRNFTTDLPCPLRAR
jgi:hypothetical protein